MEGINAFAKALMRALTARSVPEMVYNADDQSIMIQQGQSVIHLENLYRDYRQGRALDSVADLVLQMYRDVGAHLDFDIVRPLLHLALVTDDYLEQQCITRQVAPELRYALVVDYPDRLRYLTHKHLEAIGQDEDVLWQIAALNTDAKMPEALMYRLPSGSEILVFECSMGAVYAWRCASTRGTSVCGVPRRDLGVVAFDDDRDTVELVTRSTYGEFKRSEDHPLSPSSYIFKEGQIADVRSGAEPTDMNLLS